MTYASISYRPYGKRFILEYYKLLVGYPILEADEQGPNYFYYPIFLNLLLMKIIQDEN